MGRAETRVEAAVEEVEAISPSLLALDPLGLKPPTQPGHRASWEAFQNSDPQGKTRKGERTAACRERETKMGFIRLSQRRQESGQGQGIWQRGCGVCVCGGGKAGCVRPGS